MESSVEAPLGAQDQLVLLVDAVEEYAILMLDPNGRVVTWNPGAHRIKGYTADEAIGCHLSIFYTAQDIADGKPERALAQALTQGCYREEGWRVRNDDTTFWANVTITAIHDINGQHAGFAKVTRDDTDRRQAAKLDQDLELLSERDRISRELADTVVRQIFSAGLTLQTAVRLVDDPSAITRIHDVVDELDDTLRQIRAVLANLDGHRTVHRSQT